MFKIEGLVYGCDSELTQVYLYDRPNLYSFKSPITPEEYVQEWYVSGDKMSPIEALLKKKYTEIGVINDELLALMVGNSFTTTIYIKTIVEKLVMSHPKIAAGLTISYNNKGTYWRKNGQPHREGDLPASILKNGTLSYFKNGLRHRDNGFPTTIYPDGRIEWYENGIEIKNVSQATAFIAEMETAKKALAETNRFGVNKETPTESAGSLFLQDCTIRLIQDEPITADPIHADNAVDEKKKELCRIIAQILESVNDTKLIADLLAQVSFTLADVLDYILENDGNYTIAKRIIGGKFSYYETVGIQRKYVIPDYAKANKFDSELIFDTFTSLFLTSSKINDDMGETTGLYYFKKYLDNYEYDKKKYCEFVCEMMRTYNHENKLNVINILIEYT
jgi:hypothetical protein